MVFAQMTEPVDMNRFLPPPATFVVKDKTRAMMRAEIQRYFDDFLAPAIGQAVGEIARECERRCTAKLEDAMKEFVFKGAWAEGKSYRQRNFVSMGGAVYYCNADTDARPGVGNEWALLVPKPRDGKDGKDLTPPPPAPGGPRTVRSQR